MAVYRYLPRQRKVRRLQTPLARRGLRTRQLGPIADRPHALSRHKRNALQAFPCRLRLLDRELRTLPDIR